MQRLPHHWTLFLLAAQLLTRFPVPNRVRYSPALAAASVAYYPAVGLLIGVTAGAIYLVGISLFNAAVAAILAVSSVILMTGGLHEDGLADTADGVGGGRTAERALEIMRDSRIGTYGALALILVILAKVFALASMPLWVAAGALVAGHGLSRWSVVFVISTLPYLRSDGTGANVAGAVSAQTHLVAAAASVVCLLVVALFASPVAALCAFGGLVAGHTVARLFFQPKLKGYTGDCLGATQQISEIGVYLGILAVL